MTDFNRGTTSTSMGNTSSSSGTFGSGGTGTMNSTGGMGDTATTGARRWDDYRDTYRSDWESRYGQTRPWSDSEDAYRYGWQAGQDDRWRGRSFDDASSDLVRDWPNRSQYAGDDYRSSRGDNTGAGQTFGGKVEHAWENFKDTVREGFDRARMDFGGDDSDRSAHDRSDDSRS